MTRCTVTPVSTSTSAPAPRDRVSARRPCGLLARFLCEEHGHHRLTIDPAAANHRAIRCYEKVGFRRVGVLRGYERGPDGGFHDGLLMDLLRPELAGEAGELPRAAP